MARATIEREPIAPAEGEQPRLAEVYEKLTAEPVQQPVLIGPAGESIELPESLFRVLRQAVEVLLRGGGVTVVPYDTVLTTQEAAEVLNVSRQYVARLLDKGAIPHSKLGTHRRIKIGDLLDYKHRRDIEREQHLEKLARLSQELGLYNAE